MLLHEEELAPDIAEEIPVPATHDLLVQVHAKKELAPDIAEELLFQQCRPS